MITIPGLTFHIPESSEPPWIEFGEEYTYTNKTTGKSWTFMPKDLSDGATRPKLLRAFDRFINAHLAHDQDCCNALDWQQWQQGNNDYYDNLRDQGMPMYRASYHWALVSANSGFKKLSGKLK